MCVKSISSNGLHCTFLDISEAAAAGIYYHNHGRLHNMLLLSMVQHVLFRKKISALGFLLSAGHQARFQDSITLENTPFSQPETHM